MNLAGIIPDAKTPYDGIAYEIYISGCYRSCEGCHNPEMQDFGYGKQLDIETLLADMKAKEKWFDIISFLGGDLMAQDKYEIIRLLSILKADFPTKKFWLFTGYMRKELPLYIFSFFDAIKVGAYLQEQRQAGFPASKNQKLLRKGVDF